MRTIEPGTAPLRRRPEFTAPAMPKDPARARTWEASLALDFERRAARTVLAANAHRGPLRVQRALYPEGPAVCHVVLLHPPSGVAAGDRLQVDVTVGAGAHALATTPGHTRWYRRAPSAPATHAAQNVHLQAAAGATLEWLPQPNLVYEDADARSALAVTLAADARLLLLDGLILGRRGSGEGFARGRWRGLTTVTRAGRLLWEDRLQVAGGDRLLQSPLGFGGHHALLTLAACVPAPVDDVLLDALRAAAPVAGITQPAPGLVLARWVGADPQALWDAGVRAWSLLRPALLGLPGVPPRLWAT